MEAFSLPFEDVARIVLDHAGVRVVMNDVHNYDYILHIQAGEMPIVNYTLLQPVCKPVCGGGSIAGVISLRTPNESVITSRRFKGSMIPSASFFGNSYDYSSPNVVLKAAFDRSSCKVDVSEIVQEFYESEPLTVAHIDHALDLRQEAAAVLSKVGDSENVAEMIEAMRSHQDADVRKFAAAALGELVDLRALEPLLIAFENEQSQAVRKNIADVLGNLRDPRAVEALISVLIKAPSLNVQKAAIKALRKIRDPRAVEPLVNALLYSPLLQQDAASALARITEKNFGTDRNKWKEWWGKIKRNTTTISRRPRAAESPTVVAGARRRLGRRVRAWRSS